MPARKPRKWSNRDYTLAAKKLRQAGFNVSLRSGKNADRFEKAAARRLWNQNKARVSAYTNPENRFVFRRAKGAAKKKLSRVASKLQQTPRGVFLQVPKGVDPKDARFRVRGDVLEVETEKRRDVIRRIDPETLAVDPERAIREAIKGAKPSKVSLMVRGFRGKREYPLKLFFAYFVDELLPELQDEDRRGGALDEDQIADIFSVRMIYAKRGSALQRSKAKKKTAKRAKKKRTR